MISIGQWEVPPSRLKLCIELFDSCFLTVVSVGGAFQRLLQRQDKPRVYEDILVPKQPSKDMTKLLPTRLVYLFKTRLMKAFTELHART